MQNFNPVGNPMVPGQKVSRDEAGMKVDSTLYKQIVGSLMYLTATQPDLMFVVSLIVVLWQILLSYILLLQRES